MTNSQSQPLSPDPARPMPAVFLKSPTAYPLIFRKRIESTDKRARPGDWVAIYHEDNLLGYGLFNPRSEIVVRTIRRGTDLPDETFWRSVLGRAVALRRDLLRLDDVTDAYRVIHAEADGISGLVVDRYGDTLSAEAFSLGIFQRAEAIVSILHESGRCCGRYDQLSRITGPGNDPGIWNPISSSISRRA
jgi:23S rRNA (cytosine1962-C5)-methyltransferase